MKKILLILGLCAMGTLASNATETTMRHKLPSMFRQTRTEHSKGKAEQVNTTKKTAVSKQTFGAPRVSEAGQWWAQKEKFYYWDEEWMYGREDTYEYTPTGKIAVWTIADIVNGEAVSYYRSTYTYNDNDMPVQVIDEASADNINYTLAQKCVTEYDEIVTDLIISNVEEIYVEGYDDPVPGNCYKRTITRDANNNITMCEISVLFEGEYDPTERYVIGYGEDGRANTISYTRLDTDWETGEYFWVDAEEISDIIWDAFDGQIYSTDCIYGPNNRLKHASIEDPAWDSTSIYDVTYTGDNSFEIQMSGTESGIACNGILSYTGLEYGGYERKSQVKYEDATEYISEETMKFHANGLATLEYYKETEIDPEFGEMSWIEEYVGEFSGDDEAKPESYIYSCHDYDEDEMYPMARIDFDDYVLTGSGVSNMEMDTVQPTEYYNMQGIKISAPKHGEPTIVRTGGKSKIVIK